MGLGWLFSQLRSPVTLSHGDRLAFGQKLGCTTTHYDYENLFVFDYENLLVFNL